MIRLVEAANEAGAEAALDQHYARLSSPYAVTYRVEGLELSEVIR